MCVEETAGKPRLRSRLWGCLRSGLIVGMRAGALLVAIMVPVSLVVNVLRWNGVLSAVAGWVEPVFRLAGLPGEAAVAFITGAALNCYSGIAVLSAIPLDDRQVTILALVILISHNLPVEVTVQHKSGSSWWRLVAIRLVSSAVAAVVLHMLLPEPTGAACARSISDATEDTFVNWMIGTGWLVGEIAVLVVSLMIAQKILSEFGIVKLLCRLLHPVLWLLGLPRRTAFLWLVANTLGLAYGAAVIIEEAKSGDLEPRETELLNRSISVCHSLLEDTLLFVVVGAWAFWITVPRVAIAAAVVWGTRLVWRLAPPKPEAEPHDAPPAPGAAPAGEGPPAGSEEA